MAYKRNSPTPVVEGGTGIVTSTTAYAPICGGTTATGAFQAASTGLGTAGYVLTSNGSSALPSFQVAPGSSSGLILIETQTANNSASLVFSTGITSTYNTYFVLISNYIPATANTELRLQISSDGGSNYVSSNLYSSTFRDVWNTGVRSVTSASNTGYYLLGSNISGSGDNPYGASIWLYGLSSSTHKQVLRGVGSQEVHLTNPVNLELFGNNINAAAATNALRFTSSSGNLSSGVFKLYGMS